MAKKRRSDADEAEVPLSSMIDVVFLLLIFFIVTHKEIVEEALLACDLPAPDAAAKSDSEPPVLFTIDVIKISANPTDKREEAIYLVNGKKWRYKNLVQMLTQQATSDPDTTVIINCGPNARHKKLVWLLDACGEANLTNLNLVNNEDIPFVGE